MRAGLRIGSAGIALVAAAVAVALALGGCGGGADGATEQAKAEGAGATEQSKAKGEPGRDAASPRPSPPPPVVAHRIGPARVEPGEQLLPARPCMRFGRNGTTTVHILSEAGQCARLQPGERLRFVNDTGIGPGHRGARAVSVMAGDYELRLRPRGSGTIPAPVETYLGRGAHPLRVAGAPGTTILLLPPDCAMRPPVAAGEELCFR